jgi:hypothetical protein
LNERRHAFLHGCTRSVADQDTVRRRRISTTAATTRLFESKPALQTALDVIAYVTLVNPDGVTASGEEFFRTLESGGTELLLGSDYARREKLDTIVRTAVITF